MSDTSTRFVSIEWDRGHDTFDAAVCVEGPDALIVQPFHDHVPLGGLRWIRRDEIVEISDLDGTCPMVRLANIRRFAPDAVGAELVDLVELLRWGQQRGVLFFVYGRRTGSGEGLVGPVLSIDDASVTFQDVDSAGVLSDDTFTAVLEDVIALDWGTAYLDALADLVAHERSEGLDPRRRDDRRRRPT